MFVLVFREFVSQITVFYKLPVDFKILLQYSHFIFKYNLYSYKLIY